VWTVTGHFIPGQFPPGTSPPDTSSHEKYTWKQCCLALRKICRWREPVPTKVPNPNAREASYKPEQRREGSDIGESARGEKCPGGTAQGGSVLEPVWTPQCGGNGWPEPPGTYTYVRFNIKHTHNITSNITHITSNKKIKAQFYAVNARAGFTPDAQHYPILNITPTIGHVPGIQSKLKPPPNPQQHQRL